MIVGCLNVRPLLLLTKDHPSKEDILLCSLMSPLAFFEGGPNIFRVLLSRTHYSSKNA